MDDTTLELTIAVLEAHRNSGIGARLIAHLQNRVESISLSCDPANPAKRLYRRVGFEPLDNGRTLLWIRNRG